MTEYSINFMNWLYVFYSIVFIIANAIGYQIYKRRNKHLHGYLVMRSYYEYWISKFSIFIVNALMMTFTAGIIALNIRHFLHI